MIHKIFPSINDYENLSKLKVESSDFANNFDYSNLVVNKPWGYEYLWFQNEQVAIWFLKISAKQGTSLHCHAKKRTSLIVLDGLIQCSTIDNQFKLKKLDTMVLEPCVFHASYAYTEENAYIMEIETPPMKGDLIRMNDTYGRQNSGYEKTNEYSTEFDKYHYKPFKNDKWQFNKIEIYKVNEIPEIINNNALIVPINIPISEKNYSDLEIGETNEIKNIKIKKKQSITYLIIQLI